MLLPAVVLMLLAMVSIPAAGAYQVSANGDRPIAISPPGDTQSCQATLIDLDFEWSVWTLYQEPVQHLSITWHIPEQRLSAGRNNLALPPEAGPCATIPVADVPEEILNQLQLFDVKMAAYVRFSGALSHLSVNDHFLLLDGGIPGRRDVSKAFNVPESPDAGDFIFRLTPGLFAYGRDPRETPVDRDTALSALKDNLLQFVEKAPDVIHADFDYSPLWNWWYETNLRRLAYEKYRESVRRGQALINANGGFELKFKYHELSDKMDAAAQAGDFEQANAFALAILEQMAETVPNIFDRFGVMTYDSGASEDFRPKAAQIRLGMEQERARLDTELRELGIEAGTRVGEAQRYEDWATAKRAELDGRELPQQSSYDIVWTTVKNKHNDIRSDLFGAFGETYLVHDIYGWARYKVRLIGDKLIAEETFNRLLRNKDDLIFIDEYSEIYADVDGIYTRRNDNPYLSWLTELDYTHDSFRDGMEAFGIKFTKARVDVKKAGNALLYYINGIFLVEQDGIDFQPHNCRYDSIVSFYPDTLNLRAFCYDFLRTGIEEYSFEYYFTDGYVWLFDKSTLRVGVTRLE